MRQEIYSSILKSKAKEKKQFAVLIDPDKFETSKVIKLADSSNVDFIMVGGSLLANGNFEKCIQTIKRNTKIPIVIFPGNNLQISKNADGILLLSLISGRNANLLIGKHVIAAPILRSSNLEILPTGYMLIDSGKPTAATYMSNTCPIPSDKEDIAMCTAMAGEMLGLKLIYMDAGSGALNPVSQAMIEKVKSNIHIPLLIGGGISSPEKAISACLAGADVIIAGNSIEKDKTLIKNIAEAIHAF